MAAIRALSFENSLGERKRIQLLHPGRVKNHPFEASIVTGQNGSHKSSLLKQIVAVLGSYPRQSFSEGGVDELGDLSNCSLLCISGSPADRFPNKELSSGVRTTYDTPYYTYVGQRVMSNLLSRKAPLEAVLKHALAPNKAKRFSWGFYSKAHEYAGIESSVSFTFEGRFRSEENVGLRELLQKIIPSDNDLRFSSRRPLAVSYAMAQWILSEFKDEEIGELEEWALRKSILRGKATFSPDGPVTTPCSPNVLRLGLLLDIISLRDVSVQSIRGGNEFSLFDLSSGEFQMYLSVLAVGFGIEEETVLLMDEPENHLHPQWQRDFMATVFEIFEVAGSNGHIVISTHSPLIVGAAPQGTSVVDLSGGEAMIGLVSYGASSDELLLTNFGVGSSRNKVVVDTVQRAINCVERGDFNSADFLSLLPNLRMIQKALTPSDPMIEVVDALLSEGQVR